MRLIIGAVAGTRGVAVEVNSETDFVAKNDQFQDFVRKATEVALTVSGDDVATLKAAAYPDGGTVADKLTDNVATIGENQQVRRMKTVEVANGLVVPYVHNAAAAGLGALAVPKDSRSAPAEPRFLLVIFARGAWDVTYCLDPKKSPGCDVPDGELTRFAAGQQIFTAAARPSIRAFFDAHAQHALTAHNTQHRPHS